MSTLRDDLDPNVDDALVALGERLLADRPRPAPAFRGELGRRLTRLERGGRKLAPERIRSIIAGYALSGAALLVLAALGAAGIGPVA